MWSIPLLAEEGWLRHRLKVAKPPKKRRRRARSASAIARSRNSGQFGEIFRPEQFRRTDHPGRAVSERIHFYLWRVHPSSQRRGIVCASSIRSHVHRAPLQLSFVMKGGCVLMKTNELMLAEAFRKEAVSGFEKYLPRIIDCLQLLSEEEIWWRPNEASNSAGNLVLHLCGNVRQWIISALGGTPDNRERDKEFAERGPISRRLLIGRLKKTVEEACQTISRFPAEALSCEFDIQGYRV